MDLKDYHWSFGDDGCREPVCVDEEGTAADPTCFVCCEGAAPDMPNTCSVAPTVSLAPSVSPKPTGAPSVPPTPAPSQQPTLSPAPTGSPAPTTSLPPTEAPTTAQPSPAPTRPPTPAPAVGAPLAKDAAAAVTANSIIIALLAATFVV